jgi:hypothetical protein
MKNKILTTMSAILLVPGIMGAGLAAASAANASGAKADQLYCDDQTAVYYGNDRAWNDWNGIQAPGAFINFYQSTTTANAQWCAQVVSQVGSDGPFTSGSGMNTRYDGQPIYQFSLGEDQQLCADQSNFQADKKTGIDDGELQLQDCTPGDLNQWFVYSSADYLVPIMATNTSWGQYKSQVPVFVGEHMDGADANGDNVFNNWQWELQWNLNF